MADIWLISIHSVLAVLIRSTTDETCMFDVALTESSYHETATPFGANCPSLMTVHYVSLTLNQYYVTPTILTL